MVFLEKKEFRNIVNNTKFHSPYWIPVDKLTLSALQIFGPRYINPNNREVSRLLLKVGTGIGKTLTSLIIAKPFIQIFHNIFMKTHESSYISIIGFAKHVFIRELRKYPELGIITYDELYKTKQYEQKILNSTGLNQERFKAELSAFKTRINKRITSEVLGGMYKFYGYKQLFNELFDEELPKETTQDNIYELYQAGRIKVNDILLSKFKNGLLICDEIHVSYNSKEANNYGLALQLILDYYKDNVTLISLSATILSNKAREFINVVNYHRNPNTPPFKTEDYFLNGRLIKPLTPLYEALWGKVIFLEESTSDYPKLQYEGTAIPGIDYLTFQLCPMSPLHQQTYLINGLDENTTQHFMIYDMILPNPEIPAADLKLFHPDIYYKLPQAEKSRLSHYVGLFDSDQARKLIKAAPVEWKREVGIEVKDISAKDYTFTGDFLKLGNLEIYSAKKCMLLKILSTALKSNPLFKFLNYHPYVKGSGISITQEVFRHNGYLGYYDIPKPETYSSEKFITQAEWTEKYPDKEFYPIRIITLDSEVSDAKKNEFIDEFNRASDKFGKHVKGFNGGPKIEQSVDFQNVSIETVEKCPDNISRLIQIKGRTVRREALARMPENMKTVYFHILCSTYSKDGKPDLTRDTLEIKKYKRKIEEFKLIQEIEYEVNRTACNGYIFYNKGFEQNDILGAKSFKPIVTTKDGPFKGEIVESDLTYFGHNYYITTLNEFTNTIKRAFISNAVWTYDNLWEFCTKIKMSNINFKDSKDIFNLALKKIIFVPGQSLINMKDIIIFDSENYIIDKYYIGGLSYTMPRKVIVEIGKYYILVSVDTFGNLQLYPDCFLAKGQKHIYNVYVINEKKLKLSQNYIKKVLKKQKEISPADRPIYYYNFLLEFSRETHYYILQDIIEIKNGVKKMEQLPKPYIDTYTKLGILGKNWYTDEYKKNIYENGKWESYSLPPDNRQENDVIVGIIEDEKFKLRIPVLEEVYVKDKRTVERGMVCTSNVKENLMSYIAKLDAIKPIKISTQSLCNQILIKLVELEGISQKAENGKKYLIFR